MVRIVVDSVYVTLQCLTKPSVLCPIFVISVGEPEFVAANTPLVESENTEEHISNSFRRPKDSENASVPLMKPNPRKSTNLDVDAQRFYTKEAGQNLDNFSKLPKGIKLNRNIFNEKEALNKDKFKTSNYEEPIDVKAVSLAGDDDLKKEASKDWNAGEKDFSRQGGSSRRAADGTEKPTDSGFCEGAVGGLEPSDCATGGYEKLASGSEEDSGNSDSEAKGKRNFPIYAQVDFDDKDKSSEYQHLGHSFDREAETGDPSYSRLGITVPKGYCKLNYEPKRKPERKVVEENQYDQLRRDDNSDTE